MRTILSRTLSVLALTMLLTAPAQAQLVIRRLPPTAPAQTTPPATPTAPGLSPQTPQQVVPEIDVLKARVAQLEQQVAQMQQQTQQQVAALQTQLGAFKAAYDTHRHEYDDYNVHWVNVGNVSRVTGNSPPLHGLTQPPKGPNE